MTFRVLHVLQSFRPESGGPPEGVRQLINYFNVQRVSSVSIEIASLDDPKTFPLDEVPVNVFPLKKYFFDYLFPVSLFFWLLRNAKYYDRIIVDAIWDWHLLVVYLSFLFTKVPYAVFSHGHLDPWFNERYWLKYIKKLLFWPWAILPPLAFAKKVVFTCDQERLLARNSFPFYSVSEFVVSYGTSGVPYDEKLHDNAFFDLFPALADYQIVLFFGRIHPKKGIDILFRSISILHSQNHWDPDLHKLVIAGPAQGSYLAYLKDLAKDLQIEHLLEWVGPLYGDIKWSAFKSAKVFVLPSYQENFGIAVAEALSCSIPVIITDSVNIHDLISSSNAGMVSTPDVDGFAKALEDWLYLAGNKKRAMSLNARRCFDQSFSMHAFSNSYLDLLRQMGVQQ